MKSSILKSAVWTAVFGAAGFTGALAARLLHTHPSFEVKTLTARSDVDRARTAGASGYVTKDRIASELIDAVLEVMER